MFLLFTTLRIPKSNWYIYLHQDQTVFSVSEKNDNQIVPKNPPLGIKFLDSLLGQVLSFHCLLLLHLNH